MDKSQITKTANDASELCKTIMRLYWAYLENLEKVIKSVPEDQTDVLNDLLKHMNEVQVSLEHDIGIFEKALQEDLDNVQEFEDSLKINSIYNFLKK